jgi:hypothetical protein
MYSVEFIRWVDGRAEPEVVDRISGQFSSIEEAITHATTMFATVQSNREAKAFRIVENGQRVVAHRFMDDL